MRIKKITSILMICLMIFIVSSCDMNTPQKTLKDYFKALNDFEFTYAGELLGSSDIYADLETKMNDQNSYFETILNNNFIKFIYSNIKYELVTIDQKGNECRATVKITAYNVVEVSNRQQELLSEYVQLPQYLNQNIGERYIFLCDYIPNIYKKISKDIQAATTEVKLDLIKQNGKWSIVPVRDLFKALAGGADNFQN